MAYFAEAAIEKPELGKTSMTEMRTLLPFGAGAAMAALTNYHLLREACLEQARPQFVQSVGVLQRNTMKVVDADIRQHFLTRLSGFDRVVLVAERHMACG